MKGKFEYLQLPNHIQFETVSQATKLLEKRRMLYEVHEAFEQQKDEYNRKKEGLQRHEEIIRETDLNIQEQLIKYGANLVETNTKTKRAQRRLEDEDATLNLKLEEIRKQDNVIKDLKDHAEILDTKVNALKTYEDFLDDVIHKNQDQYNDVNELINRYTTLENSNKKLAGDQRQLENEQKRLGEELNEYKKTYANEILLHNNEISNLQNELEVHSFNYQEIRDC